MYTVILKRIRLWNRQLQQEKYILHITCLKSNKLHTASNMQPKALVCCIRYNCSVLRKLDMFQQTDVQLIQKTVKIIHWMTIVLQL